jgi:1,4-dihydroxy-2-naphthoate octaprenyltransferase
MWDPGSEDQIWGDRTFSKGQRVALAIGIPVLLALVTILTIATSGWFFFLLLLVVIIVAIYYTFGD